jgi:hypothetical protein
LHPLSPPRRFLHSSTQAENRLMAEAYFFITWPRISPPLFSAV